MTSAISTEVLLTSPSGFDLDASPLQRAIARASDGEGIDDLLTEDECRLRFGCSLAAVGKRNPVLVVVAAGVRGGKSLLSGCAAVKGCMSADLSRLRSHEVPRFAIVAPTLDNADATYRMLVGSVQSSTSLRSRIIGDPTADTLTLRRFDGRPVEIKVVAASRGAVTVRSRWLVGFVFDEVALFGSEPTGAVVNAEELLRAAETRLVPGAQGWLISSPFGPTGLLYQMYRDHFGRPGRVLVVHAPTRAMNPSFPQEQVDAIRARQPDVAAREYDAQWIDAETAFFEGAAIDRCTREAPLVVPPEPGVTYVAAMDPATRGNAWTLAVAGMRKVGEGEGSRVVRSVVVAREWRGSKSDPLSPRAVLREIADVVLPYGADVVWSDQYAGDALADLARDFGLALAIEPATATSNVEMYRNVETLLRTDGAELPPDAVVRQDLLGVCRRIGKTGVTVDLAKTTDGRHSDHAASVARALGKCVTEPVDARRPDVGSREWSEAAEARRKAKLVEDLERPDWMPKRPVKERVA